MNTPELIFLGWKAPAIELVAKRLAAGLEGSQTASLYRRATVVVPTAESGRRLREYMAARASAPVLMPTITLAGQLVPSGEMCMATEMETLAAWLQVLGRGMADKSLPWLLEVATQMQRVRKQLEQEVHGPEWQHDVALRFVQDGLQEPEELWQRSLLCEKERWNALCAAFAGVDEQLLRWHRKPAEQCRAAEIAEPRSRGLVIVACVPELSPMNRLYLQRLADTGAARVEIWVHAPESEAARFDAFGLPIAHIGEGAMAHRGWCECPIEIPRCLFPGETGNCPEVSDVVHLTANAYSFGLKVRELAAGCHSQEVVLASCDASFSPMLVSAFQPEWQVTMPEGRSLLASDAGRIPLQLRDACAVAVSESGGDGGAMEGFLALLRNCILQSILVPTKSLAAFNCYLTELCLEYLPGSAEHLLHLMRRMQQQGGGKLRSRFWSAALISDYIGYVESVLRLVQECQQPETLPLRLRGLAAGLQACLTGGGWQRAVHNLSDLLCEAADLVADARVSFSPQMALVLLAYMVEEHAPGALEGAGERDRMINLRGWRELCYASEQRVIIAGMHEGHVPERLPMDAYLPNAYRAFLGMSNDSTRCARDSFLLTALLHSRPVGAVHFVLSSCSTDGSPIAPSPLLLRCKTAGETAKRVSWLFSEPREAGAAEAYDLLPFITPSGSVGAGGALEGIALIAPGRCNPYADCRYSFSPSVLRSFLNCPLRFWLDCLLKLSPGDALDDSKAEPNSAEYGTLLHEVLQDVTSRYATAAPGTDVAVLASEIAEFAGVRASAHVVEKYGDANSALAVPIRLLLRNLCRTLQEFARLHAQDLCSGWEVIMLEEQLCFELAMGDEEPPLAFAMRVDRVDRHREDGRLRVLDYKSNAEDPRKTHWERLSDASAALYAHYMPSALVLAGEKGELYRWSSVQLPLYAEAIRQRYGLSVLPEAAFYNMPRSSPGKVVYSVMGGPTSRSHMSPELHEQALECVRVAASLMRKGVCLYSAESLGRSLSYNGFGALSIYKDPDPRVLCGLPSLVGPLSFS